MIAARNPALRTGTLAALTLLAAGVAMAGTLVLMKVDPAAALAALWRGSFGSWYAITSATLVRAVPLILAGLAVAIAFRAGVFNIGAEGQLLVGAAVSAAVGGPLAATGAPAIVALPSALAAAAVAGACWGGIAAWLRRRFDVLEVISTILLNFVGLYLVGFLVRGPLQEPTRIYPQSAMLEPAARLPILIGGTRLHWGIVIAASIAAITWWVLRHTAAGFRLRATGANPDAAASAGGVDTAAVASRALLVSGALAGLAGGIELTGVTYALYESISPGYGYTAIAVALLARLNPAGVLAAGVLFGALEAGATAMQRDAGVPSVLGSMLTAIAILGIVAATRRHAGAPDA